MKKFLALLCVLTFFIPVLCLNTSAAEPITIWKTAKSPKIDCVLDDSYQLIADSKKNPSLFVITNKFNIKNHVEIYACWDNENLYLYVKADCNDPHIAYQDDEAKHYIFNAHYAMTALCPDDITKEIYKGTNDDKGGWSWGDLYSKNYLYEWTTIYDSKQNKKHRADHFGALGSKPGYEYETKSEKGFDIYEQKIPMKQLTTSVMKDGMQPAVGTVFGLAVGVGFVDVGTDYKEDQVTTNLSKYFAGKNLSGMALCKLDSKLNEPSKSEETSSAASSQITSVASSAASSAASTTTDSASKTESSKAASATSSAPSAASAASDAAASSNDFDYWWLVITGSAIVVAAVVVVLIVRKRK